MTVLRVALTGGIATGKSYVLNRLGERGLPTVDADHVARDVVKPGQPAALDIRQRFGADVFRPDGTLDRPRLGNRVFSDAAERSALEGIVHPRVRQALDRWFESLEIDGQATVGVAAIPLLFETGRSGAFDQVVVTTCLEATQLQRLRERDGLSEAEARRRVAAQLPSADKVRRAQFVIDTDGSFDSTDAQVDAVCQRLQTLRRK